MKKLYLELILAVSHFVTISASHMLQLPSLKVFGSPDAPTARLQGPWLQAATQWRLSRQITRISRGSRSRCRLSEQQASSGRHSIIAQAKQGDRSSNALVPVGCGSGLIGLSVSRPSHERRGG